MVFSRITQFKHNWLSTNFTTNAGKQIQEKNCKHEKSEKKKQFENVKTVVRLRK